MDKQEVIAKFTESLNKMSILLTNLVRAVNDVNEVPLLKAVIISLLESRTRLTSQNVVTFFDELGSLVNDFYEDENLQTQ